MTTTHKPATPLPWLQISTGGIVGQDQQPLARIGGVNGKIDRAYIAHAANAYPRLIAWIKKDKSFEAQALLRELGEAE